MLTQTLPPGLRRSWVFHLGVPAPGTDYPFDMADFDPIEHVVATGFDAATTAAVAGLNAKKLLGL